jgi:hypothetical protein
MAFALSSELFYVIFFGLKVEFVMTQMKFKAITAVHNAE